MKKQHAHDYSPKTMDALEEIENLKISGQHQESIKKAQLLLCDDPNCVAALEEIADNHVSLDEFEKARKAAEHALKLDKSSYTAYYILGFIESHFRRWPASVRYLARANELHANNPEILRCLGWSTFNSGKRTQGIIILERALNLDPENSLTLCDLGVCYLQAKQFDKSIELLKKALEIDPDNKRVQECYQAAKNFSKRFSELGASVPLLAQRNVRNFNRPVTDFKDHLILY
ncbi:tetratricopeptide repeat protein [Candidatus Peregrinibacteria bacterium]|nr:MAG: tetratricopeptide repeat protein [Candidatus Peregrinibacteria bacterium]